MPQRHGAVEALIRRCQVGASRVALTLEPIRAESIRKAPALNVTTVRVKSAAEGLCLAGQELQARGVSEAGGAAGGGGFDAPAEYARRGADRRADGRAVGL